MSADKTPGAVQAIRDYWKCPHSEADERNPAPNGDADRCQNCPSRTDEKFNPYKETEP